MRVPIFWGERLTREFPSLQEFTWSSNGIGSWVVIGTQPNLTRFFSDAFMEIREQTQRVIRGFQPVSNPRHNLIISSTLFIRYRTFYNRTKRKKMNRDWMQKISGVVKKNEEIASWTNGFFRKKFLLKNNPWLSLDIDLFCKFPSRTSLQKPFGFSLWCLLCGEQCFRGNHHSFASHALLGNVIWGR